VAAFKEQIDEDAITRLARALSDVDARFAVEAFIGDATEGLQNLELKARVAHVALALGQHLPDPFTTAAEVVGRAVVDGAPWEPFDLWPVQHWAMTTGIDEPKTALALIATVTPHFSGEFAVRPFIDRSPSSMLAMLHRWAQDSDEHLRRLASEGSRPRLPWGPRLTTAPDWAVAVLDRLRNDPSEYVRRSVANHLNDLSHLDPDLALAVAQRWAAERPNADPDTMAATLRRALRTLVKRGHPTALALVGADHRAAITVEAFTLTPDDLTIGGEVELAVRLRSQEPASVTAIVDYRVDYVAADGGRNAKVFKWRTVRLDPDVPVALVRRQHFRDVSIRRHRPGPHQITVLVNGRPGPTVTVNLRPVPSGVRPGDKTV
jgi:3-methyladenine DNA glycosylase AlkC